jgi:hypothetical protein
MPLECKLTDVIFIGVFPTERKLLQGWVAFDWLAIFHDYSILIGQKHAATPC